MSAGLAARGKPGCGHCATAALCPVGGNAGLRAALQPHVREHRVPGGTLLKRQGETAGTFVVIKTGMAYVCRESGERQPRPLAVAGRGFALGMCSYLGQPNQVSCIAAAAARVCVVPTAEVRRAARASTLAEARVHQIISDNYALLARWAEAIGAHSIPLRVAASIQLLAQQAGSTRFALPAHTALAELLGTTRESVARAVALLEGAGCLARGAGRSCEVDAQRLRDWIARHR